MVPSSRFPPSLARRSAPPQTTERSELRATFDKEARRWRQEFEDRHNEAGERKDLASRWQQYSETAEAADDAGSLPAAKEVESGIAHLAQLRSGLHCGPVRGDSREEEVLARALLESAAPRRSLNFERMAASSTAGGACNTAGSAAGWSVVEGPSVAHGFDEQPMSAEASSAEVEVEVATVSYSAKTEEEEEATVPEEEEAESESELPTVPYLVDSYLATVREEEAEEVEELGTNDLPSGYYEGEEEAVHREVHRV